MEPKKTINEVRGWRWFALWAFALLIRAWGRTLRFEMDSLTKNRLVEDCEPMAVVLWHNRLFITPELFSRRRSRRRIYGLVSASKDGAWLAAFYRLVGILPVRGSSSSFGREAGRQLIEVMRDGHNVGITPDGPRGPVYSVEPGVLVVARRSRAPMLVVGAEFTRAWRLDSWDGFYIPWPFSRVILRLEILAAEKTDGSKLSPEDLRDVLLAINPDPRETDGRKHGNEAKVL